MGEKTLLVSLQCCITTGFFALAFVKGSLVSHIFTGLHMPYVHFQIYRLCGQTVICYPLCMSASDFYLSHDMAHLTDDIKSELKFISRCWRLSGRPTVCLLVTESHMRDPQFTVLLNFLSELRSGSVDGVKIRLGRMQVIT